MMFNTIEDGMGKMEILVFPKNLEKNPDIWEEEKIVLIKGKLSDKDGEFKLLCEEVNLVDENELQKFKKEGKKNGFGVNSFRNKLGKQEESIQEEVKSIIVFIPKKNAQENLGEISKLIQNSERGGSKIFITTEGRNGKLELPQRLKYSKNLVNDLGKIVGTKNIQVI